MSQELDEEAAKHTPQHVHHHICSNLFGCGDEKGIGILRDDIKERAFDNRASDRLLNMDEIDQANLDGYLSARGRWRRKFLQASSFMGALAAVGPWFDRIDNNCFYATTGEFQAVVDQLRSENGKRNARRYTLEEWRKLGFDTNSVFADPLFVDPTHHDFRVRPESPALKVGFKNFEMGKWGLTSDFPNHWRD